MKFRGVKLMAMYIPVANLPVMHVAIFSSFKKSTDIWFIDFAEFSNNFQKLNIGTASKLSCQLSFFNSYIVIFHSTSNNSIGEGGALIIPINQL